MNQNNFMGIDFPYEESGVVLTGLPYDGTVSFRPGARFAPTEVRNYSLIGYETYSPDLDRDLEDLKFFDAGDLELSIADPAKVMSEIREYATNLLKDNKKLAFIGGEHSVSAPIIEAFSTKYDDLAVIQFDAHTDLRPSYSGSEYSHASTMYRVSQTIGFENLYQFGIRSGLKEEFLLAQEKSGIVRSDFTGLKEVVESLGDRSVYITIDLDVLDPAFFPGTGTPEPNGATSRELFRAIYELSNLKNVVGFDIVELAPMLDSSQNSTGVAIKVLREMLLLNPTKTD